MELTAAIKGRRSIRKFKPQDVPKNLITEILETARWSPSDRKSTRLNSSHRMPSRMPSSA